MLPSGKQCHHYSYLASSQRNMISADVARFPIKIYSVALPGSFKFKEFIWLGGQKLSYK